MISSLGSVSNSSGFIDNPNSTMGKTDFLELLVKKLQYQDPLKPITDESFIADIAQFSSLEQMQNLNTTFSGQSSSMDDLNTNLVALMLMQNTTQAAGLIGKNALVQTTDADGNVVDVQGQVSIVRFVDGQPKIVINGNEYSLADVKEISA